MKIRTAKKIEARFCKANERELKFWMKYKFKDYPQGQIRRLWRKTMDAYKREDEAFFKIKDYEKKYQHSSENIFRYFLNMGHKTWKKIRAQIKAGTADPDKIKKIFKKKMI